MNTSSEFTRGLLSVMVTTALWGVLGIFLKLGLQDMGSINIVWYRFAVAFVILLAALAYANPESLKILKRPPPLAILSSLLLGANYLGFMKAVELGGPNVAGIVIQSGPLTLAAGGTLIYGERFSRIQTPGFLLAFFGLLLFYLSKGELLVDDVSRTELTQAVLWALFGGITWGSFTLIQKRLQRDYSSNQLNLLTYGLCTLLYTPFAKFSDFQGLSIWSWVLIVFLGANTLAAYGFLLEAMKRIPANVVSVVITLNPLITMFATWSLIQLQWEIIDYDPVSPTGFLGGVMVMFGAALVVGGARRSGINKAKFKKA